MSIDELMSIIKVQHKNSFNTKQEWEIMSRFPKNCFSLDFILNNICVNRWTYIIKKGKLLKYNILDVLSCVHKTAQILSTGQLKKAVA